MSTTAPDRASRHHLKRAQARLARLRARTDRYFAQHPYQMRAGPSEQLPDHDLYQFKLIKPIPWRLRWLTRRTLTAIRKTLDRLGAAAEPALKESDVLSAIYHQRRKPWRRLLVPGARAVTVLAMDGNAQQSSALLHAPVWDASQRKVSVLRRDPNTEFKGKVRVEFFLEFAGDPALSGQSAVALLGHALEKLESIIAAAESPQAAEPQTAVESARPSAALPARASRTAHAPAQQEKTEG